ncbi:hypothetical protein ACHHYP_14377 [Achlya hypogyna]|uniref:DDE-1 domain-containing protein n=1 Tax=Achlya hypogyna TaxID=1202772 RepID=A0A1V9YDB9_ACHHY|nr:hypothetical protein ACHHYP_14377 [Achlya hypogyna]
MLCEIQSCTGVATALACIICGAHAHAECFAMSLQLLGYSSRPDVACCSRSCIDTYALEEFLFDIDWLSPNTRPHAYNRKKVLPQRRQVYYFVRDRQALLQLFHSLPCTSIRAFSKDQNVPESTFRDRLRNSEEYLNFKCSAKRKQLGAKTSDIAIPFGSSLITFMKDTRREEHILTTIGMIGWIKTHHQAWLNTYLAAKKNPVSGRNSLLRLLQRFAHRHGFVQRVPCVSKMLQGELLRLQLEYSVSFWRQYESYKPNEILNVDETAVGASSKVDKSEKHSDRLTAVLTIRADGYKLPILFILNGKPGGYIETHELPNYPSGGVYVVQESAWMDSRVWDIYLQQLLQPQLVSDSPSVILADNLKCHASDESVERICVDLCADLALLPPNSTSILQPLDVGVMGPVKAMLRTEYLTEPKAITAAEKRIAMVKRVLRVWDAFDVETVKKAFDKALPREFEM